MSTQSDLKATIQYQAVHDFAIGHVTSLSNAHDAFAKPVEDKFSEAQNAEDIEGLLWQSWKAFLDVVKSSAQDTKERQKLVEFVLALSQRPDLEKDGVVCKVWDLTVWSDLPIFGAELREVWNTPSDSSSEEDQHAWLNISAFTANLVAVAHQRHADQPDFTLFAIWALREAFEEPTSSKIAIEAAATWLICAPQALADLSKSGKAFDGKLANAGSAFSEKQWTGYSSDRWQTWLEQLDAGDSASLGARGEDMVSKAKQRIQALDS